MTDKVCRICGEKVYVKDLCRRHYQQEYYRTSATRILRNVKPQFCIDVNDAEVLADLAKKYGERTWHLMAKAILNKVLYEMSERQFKKLMKEKK